MGLIEQEVSELRNLAASIMAGTITDGKASLMLGVYNQTSKRVNHMIQINALAAKEGKSGKSYGRMLNANIIGDGAIQIENQDAEVVKCSEQGGKCISRNDCLDYSGAALHIDNCQSCDQFSITRKQVCP